LHDRFRSGPLGDARQAEPELFARKLGVADEAGAVAARQMQKAAGSDPVLLNQLNDHLKAVAAREGGVTDDFINKYADVIEGLPPANRQAFYDAAETGGKAETALKEATAMERANQVAQRTAAGETRALDAAVRAEQRAAETAANSLAKTRLKNVVADYAADPAGTLKRLLKNPETAITEKARDLKVVTKYMDDAGQGEAFRSAVGDQLQRTLTDAQNAGTRIKPKAIQDFADMRDTLVNSGIITREQSANMTDALGRTTTAALRANALAKQMATQGAEYDNLVASALAAAVLTGMPGTQTLLVGGAVRRFIRRNMQKIGISGGKHASVAALERLMLNPEEFVAAAAKAKTAEEAAKMMISQANAAAQSTAALNEEQ
jgi:hypothetical protein